MVAPLVVAGAIGAGASLLNSHMNQAGNLAGALLSYQQQKKLMDRQAKLNYDYSIKSAKNMPMANRQGLENANYNPMLAVQNATGGANSSWTSAQSANAPDLGVGNLASNVADFIRLRNEAKQTESNVDVNEKTADKLSAEKSEITARLPYVAPQKKAEIANIEADTALKEAQNRNLFERLKLDRDLGFAGLDVNRYGINQRYNASQNYINFLEEHSPSGRSQSFRNYMDAINGSINSFGNLIGSFRGQDKNYYYDDWSETTHYDAKGKERGRTYTRKGGSKGRR